MLSWFSVPGFGGGELGLDGFFGGGLVLLGSLYCEVVLRCFSHSVVRAGYQLFRARPGGVDEEIRVGEGFVNEQFVFFWDSLWWDWRESMRNGFSCLLPSKVFGTGVVEGERDSSG